MYYIRVHTFMALLCVLYILLDAQFISAGVNTGQQHRVSLVADRFDWWAD